MKFKRHIISSLLLAASLQVQPVLAVEFTAVAEVSEIAAEEDRIALAAPEEVSVNDPSLVVIDEVQAAPAPVYQAIDADDQLANYLNSKGLRTGWSDKKQMYIAIGSSAFDVEDPSYDDSFITKRAMKSMEATLNAKVEIIEYINTTMSAKDRVEVAGTDIYKAFNERKVKNQKRLDAKKRYLAKLLEDVDKKQAAALRGATFSDRASAMMDAAIKRLDKEYSSEKIEAKKLSRYERAKDSYQQAQTELVALEKEINGFQGQERGKSSSQVATLSKMPLFGALVVNQFESWSEEEGRYRVALLVMWSKSTEKMARSMITGQELIIPPGPVTLQAWLNTQDWATMTGGRRFRDEHGDGWFIGVDARPIGSSASSERQARGLAEMGAKKEVAMSLFADMESQKLAETVLVERTNKQGQDTSEAMGSYAASLRSSIKNRSISGLQKLYGKKVVHPISGQKMVVAVYGMSSNTARKALAMQESNYVTKLLDVKSQQKLKGTKAGLNSAVRAAEQDKTAYREAKRDARQQVQQQAVKQSPAVAESSVQQHKAAPKNNKGSQAGVYGGGGADSFDW